MENDNATNLSLFFTNENSDFTIADDINGPALAVVVGLEFLISLVINIGVLMATFAQPSSLKKPSTIFLSFLVGANLIMTLFFMPFTIISAAAGEWIFGSTYSQKTAVCTFV
uniref:G-protein coupled receptors family 1 profile domain-containing protein n=1 Tax=Amphimedon queenslandica TaxID=400682 RepID=A0A1X7TN64_AMPQE